MRPKTSVKPSAYPKGPVHLIRLLIFLSSIVIGVILAVFIYHLHADGYKLPFAFLIVRTNKYLQDTNTKTNKLKFKLLVSAILSILNVLLASLLNCACGLSTKLSVMLNTLLLLLWLLALALLSYSLAHTVFTACNTTYWANKTGIAVCRSYKALFAFTLTATVSQVAALWLDLVVRRRQTRLGAYDPMGSTPGMLGEGPMDVKLADRGSVSVSNTTADYESVPPPMLGAQQQQPYTRTLEYGHAGEAAQYYEAAPARSRRGPPTVRYSSYEQEGYVYPGGQTGYDPAMYR